MKKIVSHKSNKYSIYLSSLRKVRNVEVLESGNVQFDLKIDDEEYTLLFLGLSDYKMPTVFLSNPDEGATKKPHRLYLKKSDLLHLCLSVKDDISVRNYDYEQIIDYTLKRIEKLLTLSDSEEEREYRKEFLYFWNCASSNEQEVEIFINSEAVLKELSVFKHNKKSKMCISDNEIDLNQVFMSDYTRQDMPCIYLPIRNVSGILPPLNGEQWNDENLKFVLEQCISDSNIDLFENILINKNEIIIIFEMLLPNVLPVTFMIKLHFANKKAGNVFNKIKSITRIEHWKSQRCDSSFLFKRIGYKGIKESKRILVVGAGSLGSYILTELPKIGINEIAIFDYDKYNIENIFRHRLDTMFTGSNKTFAMYYSLSSNYPESKIQYFNERFNVNSLESYELDQYDLIVIATGGSDYMLGLNREFNELKIKIPVMYSWIEPNGIAVHTLIVDYTKKGCFKCLYSEDGYNKAHFNKSAGKINLTSTGCGGVFNSYGTLTLLKGTSMIIELIQMYFENKLNYEFNPLYSTRTLSYQIDSDTLLNKGSFINDHSFYIDGGCDICGS